MQAKRTFLRATLGTPWALALGAFALLPLIGCVSTGGDAGALEFASKQARNRQLGLTALMAVDTAQTVTIGRSSECLFEANPIAAAVFGTHTPSPERVLITNAIYITGHWLLASYLDRKAEAPPDLSVDLDTDLARKSRWSFARALYQLMTFAGHGLAVASNASKGIKPFSSYECGSAR